MEENKLVYLYLFSEMTEHEDIKVIRYSLTPQEAHTLKNSVVNNVKLLPFGDYFHHTDDIIKFNFAEAPAYMKF